jgi:hypothetical protein
MKQIILLTLLTILAGCCKTPPNPIVSIKYFGSPEGSDGLLTYNYFGSDFMEVQYQPYPAENKITQTFTAKVPLSEKNKKAIDQALGKINPDRYADRYANDELCDGPTVRYLFCQKGKTKQIEVYCAGVENLLLLSAVIDAALPLRYQSGIYQYINNLGSRHADSKDYNAFYINPDAKVTPAIMP